MKSRLLRACKERNGLYAPPATDTIRIVVRINFAAVEHHLYVEVQLIGGGSRL